MPRFSLYHEAGTRANKSDDLCKLLKAAWTIANNSGGLDKLQRIDKDEHTYLDTQSLHDCVGQIEVCLQRGGTFDDCVKTACEEVLRRSV